MRLVNRGLGIFFGYLALRREATTFLLDQKSSQKNQVRGHAHQ